LSFPANEDHVLIARFREGDKEAFDRLMERYTDKLYSVAWGVLMNRDDAVDAVQDVFIKLHGALPKFSPNYNLGAWLYRVMLNQCIDRKRRANRNNVDLTEEDWERLQGPKSEDPEFSACRHEAGRIIRQSVDQLPNRQRLVFILRHYRLLSLEEIAVTMGCSTGAVKAHLSRATAHLRDKLRHKLGIVSEEARPNEV
jgi:RNA polymerase sigma-70 factor (ECF subfamily)